MKILKAALNYLNAGISPIPLNGKVPIKKGWQKNFAKTVEDVNEDFSSATALGIVCGKASGGLEGIDVDTKYDLTGELWNELHSLIEDNLPDVNFVVCETKSGGKHVIYRCDEPGRNQKLASRETIKQERENEKDSVRVLIETRGEGGQLAAYPTPGYSVISGKFSEVPFLSQEERACLMSICKSFDELPESVSPQKPQIKTQQSSINKSPFEDYNEKTHIPDLLAGLGWTFVNKRGNRWNFKRPGQTDSKTSANWREDINKLWVWTTSSQFEAEKALSPVDLWQTINGITDPKETYKSLLNDGYGEAFTPEPEPEEEPEIKQEFQALAGTPYFEDWIFDSLPYPLNKITQMYEGRERDMSLIMSLTTCSAILTNVKGLYHGKETHPNLYGIAIATAGTGKGIFNYARALGYATIEKIKAENEADLAEWQHECESIKTSQGKNAITPDEPRPRKPFISANATSKGLINQMSLNGELGTFAIETEIDSVANMIKTEHGDITAVLRNAWEHEDIGTVRATSESNDLENPKLSLLLAGTPGQLPKLFADAENGLFSRCMLYAYKSRPVFKNPLNGSKNYKEIFRNFSYDLEDIRSLIGTDSSYSMSYEQGEKLTAKYNPYLLRYWNMNGEGAISIVLRMGKQVYKIAQILQRLAIGKDFKNEKQIEDKYFDLALCIGDTLLKHSFNIFDMLFANKVATKRTLSKEQNETAEAVSSANEFFDALPDEFTTAEARTVLKNIGYGETTLKRNLKEYLKKGLIEKPSHGLYSKCKILK